LARAFVLTSFFVYLVWSPVTTEQPTDEISLRRLEKGAGRHHGNESQTMHVLCKVYVGVKPADRQRDDETRRLITSIVIIVCRQLYTSTCLQRMTVDMACGMGWITPNIENGSLSPTLRMHGASCIGIPWHKHSQYASVYVGQQGRAGWNPDAGSNDNPGTRGDRQMTAVAAAAAGR